jgi:hypothetical protein
MNQSGQAVDVELAARCRADGVVLVDLDVECARGSAERRSTRAGGATVGDLYGDGAVGGEREGAVHHGCSYGARTHFKLSRGPRLALLEFGLHLGYYYLAICEAQISYRKPRVVCRDGMRDFSPTLLI